MKPFATSLDMTMLVASGGSPVSFEGELSFSTGYDGGVWQDVIGCPESVILFSESVRCAIESSELKGARFIEAPITEVLSSSLKKKPMPKYYRLLAEGRIVLDQTIWATQKRWIPSSTEPPTGCDFSHVIHPVRAKAAGYFCSLRAIEVFRKHKLKNFYIKPMDYVDSRADPFIPPFRIKLNERKWPPTTWYPEGFVPHPNNLVAE